MFGPQPSILPNPTMPRGRDAVQAFGPSTRGVLIADDHQMFADLLARYLAPHYTILPPVLSLDAIEPALAMGTAEVLLLDILFGEISSIDRIAAWRAAHPELRIIIVTGCDRPDFVAAALAVGVHGYVLKLNGPAEVLVAVAAVLAGRTFISAEALSDACRVCPGRRLSRRQRELLQLLRSGHSEHDAARRLGIAVSTAEKHVRRLKDRLGITGKRAHVNWTTVIIDGD